MLNYRSATMAEPTLKWQGGTPVAVEDGSGSWRWQCHCGRHLPHLPITLAVACQKSILTVKKLIFNYLS